MQPLEHDAQRGREALVLEPGQVGAGAEVAAGAGEDEDAGDRISASGGGDRRASPVKRLAIDGVAALGPIDRDERDGTALFVMDHSSITAIKSPSVT